MLQESQFPGFCSCMWIEGFGHKFIKDLKLIWLKQLWILWPLRLHIWCEFLLDGFLIAFTHSNTMSQKIWNWTGLICHNPLIETRSQSPIFVVCMLPYLLNFILHWIMGSVLLIIMLIGRGHPGTELKIQKKDELLCL